MGLKIKTKVTPSVKEILDMYDAEDILEQFYINADSINLNINIINAYINKIKSTSEITITLSEQIQSWLNDLATSLNIKFAQLLNFLIEIQADLSKINSKKVKQALNFYYDAVENNKPLFSQILEGFANSPYYEFKDAEGVVHEGLTEEGVVKFLIFTQERTEFIKK